MPWSSVCSCPVPQGEGSQWLRACGGLYTNTPGAANPQGSWERSGHASTVTSALEKFPASPSCRTKTHGMRAVHSLWPSTGCASDANTHTQIPICRAGNPSIQHQRREVTLRQLHEAGKMQSNSLHCQRHFDANYPQGHACTPCGRPRMRGVGRRPIRQYPLDHSTTADWESFGRTLRGKWPSLQFRALPRP